MLFDLDGVVTPTAEIHERAWSELFAPWEFTHDDYLTYVDGKPRYDGVASFLAVSRRRAAVGDPDDLPGDDTICALGNRKNDTFNEVLARDGIEAYTDAIELLDVLDAIEVAVGDRVVVEERQHGARRGRIRRRFLVVVDGITAVEHDLAGKPDPAMFPMRHTRRCVG